MKSSTITSIIITTILTASVSCSLPVSAQDGPATTSKPAAIANTEEPAVLKKIIASHWHLENARPALPPVQVIHEERVFTQDWIEYAFEGGALRLFLSRESKPAEIFAVLVDIHHAKYSDFTTLISTDRYAVYHHDPYVLVLPVRPISPTQFNRLKGRRWTEKELRKEIGPASNDSCEGCFNGGPGRYLHLLFVPQGLSFESEDTNGSGSVAEYQLEGTEGDDGPPLPPLTALSTLEYGQLQRKIRDGFAKMLFDEREYVESTLAKGMRSPDGRFVVGDVDFSEAYNDADVVIGERNMPERYYRAAYFAVGPYRWLDGETVAFEVCGATEQLYTLDAVTGDMNLVADIDGWDPHTMTANSVVDFGASGPHTFWYKTEDGQKHEVNLLHRRSRPREKPSKPKSAATESN